MNKKTHIVKHPSLYLMVNNKMQEMKVGDEITLTGKQSLEMERKGFVEKIKVLKTKKKG